jgi:translation initiation factor 2B subunit (eIF-2B alpha/beta/delta family)
MSRRNEEIIGVIDKEISTCIENKGWIRKTELSVVGTVRAHIKTLKKVGEKYRTTLQVSLNNACQKLVKITSSLDTTPAAKTLEQQQKTLIKDMEALIRWLDRMMQELVREDLALLEDSENIGDWDGRDGTECNKRVKALLLLAQCCGVKEDLKWKDN